jgi:hypothetical protein
MSLKEEELIRKEKIRKMREELEKQDEIERQELIKNKVKEIENKNLIKIDNFYFLVLNKNITKDRPIVNIYSSTNENFSENNKKFSVYLSNSDLGCFRLCVVIQNRYEKGDDYIQSSFIHIKLQEYIHKIFNNLELSDDYFCSYIQSDDDKYVQKIYHHICDKERQIKKTPFIEYNEYACGGDHDKSSFYVNEKLNNFSEELKSLYDYSNNKQISKVNINDLDNVYYLEFYKVELKLKNLEQDQDQDQDQDQEYINDIILYYCNAEITTFMNKIVKPNPTYINLPVFLTTEEGDKITEFGTFNKYILAGNYICKVFDYISQCPIDHTGQCFGNYKLIGEKYNNIFPLLEIREKAGEQAGELAGELADEQADEQDRELARELAGELAGEQDKKQARKHRKQNRKQRRVLAGGVIQIINDRCDTKINNIIDSNCNQKIQKIQNIYNVRKQLIEDTERFFNKKINKKLNL